VVDRPEETFAAFRYLSGLRHRADLDPVRTRLRVECGDPAEHIIDLSRDRLVVLTKPRHWLPAHGLTGSIADHVCRTGAAALLIARQGTSTHRGHGCSARPQLSSRFPTVLPSISTMRYAPAPA
jgi:hypothetical protein